MMQFKLCSVTTEHKHKNTPTLRGRRVVHWNQIPSIFQPQPLPLHSTSANYMNKALLCTCSILVDSYYFLVHTSTIASLLFTRLPKHIKLLEVNTRIKTRVESFRLVQIAFVSRHVLETILDLDLRKSHSLSFTL